MRREREGYRNERDLGTEIMCVSVIIIQSVCLCICMCVYTLVSPSVSIYSVSACVYLQPARDNRIKRKCRKLKPNIYCTEYKGS